MRRPLKTWCGSVLQPIEPGWRCTFLTPCEARWPWKLCRFITPAVPRPLLVPTTSTDFDFGEDVDLQFLADLNAIDGAAELANESLRFAVGLGGGLDPGRGAAALPLAIELGDVAASGAAGKTTGLIEKAQLNGLVAVSSAASATEGRDRDRPGSPSPGPLGRSRRKSASSRPCGRAVQLPSLYAFMLRRRREHPALGRLYPL